jgi:hypothetical protein
MTLSLYDASVVNYLQILDAMSGVLDKAQAHFKETGTDPDAFLETRLAPDMLPFAFQLIQVSFHSLGAVEAVMSGELKMRERKPPVPFAEMAAQIEATRAALREVDADALNARAGERVVFNAPGRTMTFTGEGFLQSFALPNFYFHASMAYAILRTHGVPLGKRDFMGQLRLAT